MKYFIIPYVALGFVLSLAIGIEYNCEGTEMFPIYYGSPFVFKQESLASSMEYFYSISGLVSNILVWSLVLFFIDKGIQILILKINNIKLVSLLYKITIVTLIAFTTLNIFIDSVMFGSGFGENFNYWYWNMDKEAKVWGMTCEGKVILFRK